MSKTLGELFKGKSKVIEPGIDITESGTEILW